MKRVSFASMDCSVAQALEVVGEWWTPLIIREVMWGRRRFDEIQDDLGISRNILTDRLNRLVEEDILFRQEVTPGSSRHEYRLTEKGLDLDQVLLALLAWGDKWAPNPKGPPVELLHRTCDHVTHPAMACSHCGELLERGDIRARPGAAFAADPDHALNRAAHRS